MNKIIHRFLSAPSKHNFRWTDKEYLNSPTTWESLDNSKMTNGKTP